MTAPPTPDAPQRDVELVIGGMTCASCAARVEKKLNRLDGVTASVNYATEKATIHAPAGVSLDELVGTVEATGYTAAVPVGQTAADTGTEDPVPDPEAATTAELRRRLLISLALAVPVVVLSMVPALQFSNWQWLALTLAAPVAVWGAWPFHRAAWTNLRHRAATMDTLVSVGVLAAFLWSVWALFVGDAGRPGMTMHFSFTASGGDEIYLEVAAAVTVFILAGRYAEARAKRRSSAALRELLALGAKDVAVLRCAVDGVEREQRVPIGELAVGDRFVVRPGEKFATDGRVESGRSAVDTAVVTGESVPAEVAAGDDVIGATVNVGGRLIVVATRVGADTHLAQVARLVEQAQNGKAQVQRLADRVSSVFVPVVLAIAVATAVAWVVTGHGWHEAFTAMVAVLIIACPCALGLATPTALMVGTGRGAQLGIVIKGPEVLENTRRIDTVVLDKTGTVTTGRMAVHDIVAADGEEVADLLAVAGAVEAGSEHPIAAAIVAAASRQGPSVGPLEDFAAQPGLGVTGVVTVAGIARAVVVGNPTAVADWAVVTPPRLDRVIIEAQSNGRTAVVVAWDGAARGVIVVGDTVKPDSAAAVRRFRALGLRPVLLTGDNAQAAAAVAREVGIAASDVIAGVLPAGKVDAVRGLQAGGATVAMVGDGVNDAAALATSDLGVALGTGADVAIEASDLTLVRGDLTSAVDAIRLARRTLATIKGNLFWAFAYNVAALPLAAFGLLNPLIAGAAMAASSVFVVTNSLRLRRFASR